MQNQQVVNLYPVITRPSLFVQTRMRASRIREAGAWKWISKITESNQSVAVNILKVTSVQTRMRMIKLLYEGCNLKANIVLFLILISNITYAAPAINTSFKFYNIYPSSKNDLGREMHKRSPIKKNGTSFKGHTKWYVKWNFKWKKRNGNCRITKVTTSLDVRYTIVVVR